MSSHATPFASSSISGQDLTQKPGNKVRTQNPGLTVYVPENRIKYRISVELGSPFGNKFPTFCTPRTSFRSSIKPPSYSNYRSTFYDSDDTDSESESECDEDIAQYITLSPSSPFYSPPPRPRRFACDFSFSCDALAEEGTSHKEPAMLFHEALDRISPGGFAVNADCLQGLEMELLLSPMDVFQETCYLTSPKRASILSLPSTPCTCWTPLSPKPLADVPEEVDLDTLDEKYSYCDEDYFSSDDELDEEELPLPSLGARAIDAQPSLDRRLVAPFEDHSSFRTSIVPTRKFCGLFSMKRSS